MKKLYRSEKDKMIAGVVGGIAEYFGIESTLLRIATVVAFVFTGFFPIGFIYIIAIFVMPRHPEIEYTVHDHAE